MPKYTIHYFKAYGRAELIRTILGYSDIAFDDVFYTFEQWPAVQATGKFPGGLIPCVEVQDDDGSKVMLGQSHALARYFARETGIAGNNHLEMLRAEAVVDAIYDLVNKIWQRQFVFASNPQKQAEIWLEIETTIAPRVFKYLNDSLQGPYFVGDHLTWADLAFVDACSFFWEEFNEKVKIFIQKYPRLMEHREMMLNDKKLAAYYARRTQHPY